LIAFSALALLACQLFTRKLRLQVSGQTTRSVTCNRFHAYTHCGECGEYLLETYTNNI